MKSRKIKLCVFSQVHNKSDKFIVLFFLRLLCCSVEYKEFMNHFTKVFHKRLKCDQKVFTMFIENKFDVVCVRMAPFSYSAKTSNMCWNVNRRNIFYLRFEASDGSAHFRYNPINYKVCCCFFISLFVFLMKIKENYLAFN